MSASNHKKNRQEERAQGPTSRQQKRQQQEQAERRTMWLYAAVGIVVAVLAVFLVVWNSGVIQRNTAAITVNGTKYCPADVQFYYNSMASQYGMSTSSLENVIFDGETGQTMGAYLLEQAVDTLVTATALSDQAKAEGFTITPETQTMLDNTLASLKGSSGTSYLRTNYGPYMTYGHFAALLERQALVEDYKSAKIDQVEYSDGEYDAYYQENRDSLDTYTLTQFVFQATVPTAEEGEERTAEEETALLEQAKVQAKASAQALMDRLQSGEDPETLAQEYDDELYSSNISETRMGESNSTYNMSGVNSTYSEWVFDAARRNGDVTIAEYDGGSSYNYYVVRFEGRVQDDTPVNNVRHILIATDDATDSEQAKARAEELLAQWKAGEATEDSFAALAETESDDAGSASNGGLITNVSPTSSYVDSFRDWANDSSRKAGDAGLVESEYGWHIMYYVPGMPIWKQIADDALRDEAYIQWVEAAREGYEAVEGFGMRFVQ